MTIRTLDEAVAEILAKVSALPATRQPLTNTLGRSLAQDLLADIDNPPFDNSAVDGYAVRAADAARPGVVLRCIGFTSAGDAPDIRVEPGCCLRVMTGAPMPCGADAMVMIEDTRVEGDQVEVLAAASEGDHVRRRGQDVQAGDRVLTAGTRIGAAETLMMAAFGCTHPLVHRAPSVAVFSTGDELVPPDSLPGPGQIRDSNRFALMALVRSAGATLHSSTWLPDDEAETERAFRSVSGLDGSQPADVILTSGGVSVGDRDYIKPVVERLGSLDLWRVNMKPGKPLAYGRVGASHFFGLPGNPASTMVTFELFVRPALRKLAGETSPLPRRVWSVLSADVPHLPGRQEFVRVWVQWEESGYVATPTGPQGSGMLRSMVGANALAVLPAGSGDHYAGDRIETLLLEP